MRTERSGGGGLYRGAVIVSGITSEACPGQIVADKTRAVQPTLSHTMRIQSHFCVLVRACQIDGVCVLSRVDEYPALSNGEPSCFPGRVKVGGACGFHQPLQGGQSVFFSCITSRRISARASTNQGPEKDVLVRDVQGV